MTDPNDYVMGHRRCPSGKGARRPTPEPSRRAAFGARRELKLSRYTVTPQEIVGAAVIAVSYSQPTQA